MSDLAEYVGGLPNICGEEARIASAMSASRGKPIYLARERD